MIVAADIGHLQYSCRTFRSSLRVFLRGRRPDVPLTLLAGLILVSVSIQSDQRRYCRISSTMKLLP